MEINEPFANFYRPKKLEDVVGQSHLLNKDAVFYQTINSKKIPNMIFYGPPGIGKTTVAEIIAHNTDMKLYKLNGTTAKLDDVKAITDELNSLLTTNKILLYLDEIQYFNKKQQQTLLDFIENGSITLIASTTENPMFYIYPALLSRCMVFEFKALKKEDIKKRLLVISKELEIKIDDKSLDFLSIASNGDMRKAINYLEFLYQSKENITLKRCEEIVNKANINYDRAGDAHYDTLSAFHKSIRGSDVNAALFYLAKLLDNGDLIAACRRLLCVANEDIGLANPQVISLAKDAVDSALMLGLPEGRLPLSNITILLASSPKSNSALSIDSAIADVRAGKGVGYPRAVQNKHYDGKDAKVKGQDYKYPHDFKNHYVDQQYLPDDIKDAKYYEPGDNKTEQNYAEYLKKIKNNS